MFSLGAWDTKVAKTGKAARMTGFSRVMLFILCNFVCSLLVFPTRKWPEQATLKEGLASIESCFRYIVFVFSIGLWNTKVSTASKGVRVTSLDWFLVHESSQNKQWCVSDGLFQFSSVLI